MSDKCQVAAACDLNEIREAVCIHTNKICDACIDKDCIEDLRVFLTRESQAILDRASSAKARKAELLHVNIDVEPIAYNSGHFTVDITYYYRIIADAIIGGVRPTTIYGLAVFTKRVILSAGEGGAKIFSSCTVLNGLESPNHDEAQPSQGCCGSCRSHYSGQQGSRCLRLLPHRLRAGRSSRRHLWLLR